MCDERCSANFMLPEPDPDPEPDPEPERAEAAVRSERTRDFSSFTQLGCSTRAASEAPGRAALAGAALAGAALGGSSRTPLLRRAACLCGLARSAALRRPVASVASVAQRLCSVPPRARLRTLPSAIAWGHGDVFASQGARRSTGRRAADGTSRQRLVGRADPR